jgi:hypothetical protein
VACEQNRVLGGVKDFREKIDAGISYDIVYLGILDSPRTPMLLPASLARRSGYGRGSAADPWRLLKGRC